MGDIDNNYLQLYSPPEHYEENWADFVSEFLECEKIAQQYLPVDLKPKAGHLYIFDCATLHVSKRNSHSKERISLEMIALLKEKISLSHPKTKVERKFDEKVTAEDLEKIGITQLLCVQDTMSGSIEKKQMLVF